MKSGETVWAKRGWKVYDDTSCRLVWRVWWMYGRLGGSAVGNAMYGYLRVVVRGTWGGYLRRVLVGGARPCSVLADGRRWPSRAVLALARYWRRVRAVQRVRSSGRVEQPSWNVPSLLSYSL